ncbi:MAG: hypothetical protein PHF35_02365 [Candidatus Moranbacteria bacterium]|nr:hypothetical protein [Candidatus Moranbacteria bacterium]
MSLSFKKLLVKAFYHHTHFDKVWEMARKFAGKGGRIATLPDIIQARLRTGLNSGAWSSYFTTTTTEYIGFSRGGNKIIIVAHNVGPLSTLEGILNAYTFWKREGDRDRATEGGMISQKDFLALESGNCGEVSVIDYDALSKLYGGNSQIQYGKFLGADEAMNDPLLNARLGPRAKDYISRHAEFARKWHQRQIDVRFGSETRHHLGLHHLKMAKEGSNPFIIFNRANFDSCLPIKKTLAYAHLIHVQQLSYVCFEHSESLLCKSLLKKPAFGVK